jgi:hypothetical protein
VNLNLFGAEMAHRRRLLEELTSLQSPIAIEAKKNINATHQNQNTQTSPVQPVETLSKAQSQQILDKFQSLPPVLKTALQGTQTLRQGMKSLEQLIQTVPPTTNANHQEKLPAGGPAQPPTPAVAREAGLPPQGQAVNPARAVPPVPGAEKAPALPPQRQQGQVVPARAGEGRGQPGALPILQPNEPGVAAPTNQGKLPAGGPVQAPIPAVAREAGLPPQSQAVNPAQAVPPALAAEKAPALPPQRQQEQAVPARTGEGRVQPGALLTNKTPLPAEKEPAPLKLSLKPAINLNQSSNTSTNMVLQNQNLSAQPIVAPSGGLTPELNRQNAIQAFRRASLELQRTRSVAEARQISDLLSEHPLFRPVSALPANPQTLSFEAGSTAELVTKLTNAQQNGPTIGTEILARTAIRGDNTLLNPAGRGPEGRVLAPENGNGLLVNPRVNSFPVPPLSNISQLRPSLPTNLRSRLVAVATVNLLDLIL